MSRWRPWRSSSKQTADPDDDLAADLRAALGDHQVRTEPLERALMSRDASTIHAGSAGPVCFPESTADVVAIVEVAHRHGRAVVPRGAGTGLAAGAVACEHPVMVVTTRMQAVRQVDPLTRRAWVEPGVVNLDLSRSLRPDGLHFAPDPSSQQSCTIGGNIANNSGGPHCLAYGVTSAHVLALETVLADGRVVVLGGTDPEPAGYDLRGAVVGSEGTTGIVTAALVRLTPDPPAVTTMLAAFDRVGDAASAVTGIIAAGIVPAALEMMDQRAVQAAENFVQAGYPTDAAAVLLVEVDGLPGGVAAEAEAVASILADHGASSVRVATDDDERQLLWKGRKTAFGAVAQIAPNYYLHDTVIPRTSLETVLTQVYEIAAAEDLVVVNVFHAGDGNLHPLLVYDAREPGVIERVEAAGRRIVEVSLAAGGVLSGEHGIGLEKREFMERQFTPADLDAQARLRDVFDPDGRCNPGKILPGGASCADIAHLRVVPDGVWV